MTRQTSTIPAAMLALVASMTSLSACKEAPPAAQPTTVAAPITVEPSTASSAASTAKPTLEKFECNRCHVIDAVEPTTVNMDCRGCHRQIIERTYPEPDEYLAMWDEGLENMRDVPSLVAIGVRFHRDWFIEFVTEPHDLRPRLGATMPRMAITMAEARALADELGLRSRREAQKPSGRVDRGRDLVETKGCGSCHVMSGLEGGLKASPIPVDVEPEVLTRAVLLAPDLRETRDRFHADGLQRWLTDPASVKRDTLMPRVPLTDQEATDVAAFLLGVSLDEPTAPSTVERPPPLEREVRWKEVQTELFDEICLHCHSDPKYNEGDGGPGNTGGFGFTGKKLDLSSYERAIADRSFYEPLDDGTPKMIAHLLARHEEVAGRSDEEILGMPLGFPPIEMERIRLLDSWIRHGLPE